MSGVISSLKSLKDEIDSIDDSKSERIHSAQRNASLALTAMIASAYAATIIPEPTSKMVALATALGAGSVSLHQAFVFADALEDAGQTRDAVNIKRKLQQVKDEFKF